ncbi:hypothetical protein AEP_01547 [Curvibacter sp. AEP1-3]|uniref:replication endonuclease n=1 Tax=Curvibacter sp. AEP1-3 TaxID=1844971 RepID=UPI000B3BE486|nr:replication endonuclease [Curvibacter sp. AEP1-3]ARV18493.1 hypothetical protein AEP_01547 [Curvibacter sp. AEP1-3]
MHQMHCLRTPTDAEWTYGRTSNLPPRWESRLLKAWKRRSKSDYYGANVELRETTESLLRVRIPLDASDADVCEAAKLLAERCAGRAELFHTAAELRAAMERLCNGQGITPPPEKTRNGPAISRMCCPLWWRRKLRKHQGHTVEAAAIRLGFVNRLRDLYVSNERLRARIQQNQRNTATLEATIATNEYGQHFTLAELAAKGTANKAIRRAELMTRISGFERLALSMGHVGQFITITCPSRFHRFLTVNNGAMVVDNKNYDAAENPKTAQRYLAKVWSRIRSHLARQGIALYGIRIAEPQHDGTPHWHLLVFCLKESVSRVQEIMKKHALNDNPNEPGAQERRCDFKLMDPAKGSAAGYVAKYIAKNIDGQYVGNDLNGQPATTTAIRVEAWATTWGIRQFQQVGGPPVGVWRELRRIEALPANAPAHLKRAHDAVNKIAVIEGRDNASAAWDEYCRAQDGPFSGRRAPIKLAMYSSEKLGMYGDPASQKPFGVETTAFETYADPNSAGNSLVRAVYWVVESKRLTWEITSRNNRPALIGEQFAERMQSDQPWTSVNNCTERKFNLEQVTF